MIPVRYPYIFTLTILTLLAVNPPAYASAGDAYQRVQDGIRRFAQGDFEGAVRAFSDADVSLPEDDRIAFDRACAYLANRDVDKAVELLRESAQSQDVRVAAASRYNLGGVAVAKAKAVFAGQAELAPPEKREEGVQHLVTAIAHYRDCLDIAPNHERARKNLEVLRLWLKHMQDVWSQRDREQQRNEMDLLQLLEMITERQEQLHGMTGVLANEADSPRRRQAVRETARSQRELTADVDALKDKAEQSLQPPPGPAPDDDGGQAAQALAAFQSLADQVRTTMDAAADHLDDAGFGEAEQAQAKALESLNVIYTAVAPFQHLLQKSIATQEPLVNQSQAIVDAAAADTTGQDEPPEIDWPESVRKQTMIAGWCQALPPKAQAELDQLAAQPAAGTPAGPGQPPAAQLGQPAPEEMKAALEKAIELAPQAAEQADLAMEPLEQQQAAEALPYQSEALRLLKEIAEQLPKQPQQDQNQDDQKKDDQDDQQQDQRPQNQDPQQPPQQQPQPQQKPEQQQAEATLRKAKQRERDYRDVQKQLQALMRGNRDVDRDW